MNNADSHLSSNTWLDAQTDDQLIAIAAQHLEKFNCAWKVAMLTHYSSGRHVDATAKMDRAYAALGNLHRYIYNYRPAALHDRFCAAANWEVTP